MATGRLPDPNSAPVTSKGDLYTYSTRADRLAVGNNGDTLVADSSTTTGLRWQGTQAAGRNIVTNGGFDIWQRGTSGLTANSISAGAGYNADRWQNYSANSITISRQATGDTTNLPFIQYCARVQRNSGQTNLGEVYTVQSIETANSLPLVGRAVTLSFYARRGANFSASSNTFTSAIYYGTGTDQNIFSFTGQTVLVSGSHTLTTTWQRFQITATMPATATEIAPVFYYVPTGTAGAADYYELTGVQIELGSVATPFTRAGGTLAGELAACQRYYTNSWETNFGAGGTGGNWVALNVGTATTGSLYTTVVFPVKMRSAPTLTLYDVAATPASGKVYKGANAKNAVTSYIGTTQALGGTDDATSASYLLFGWVASAEL